MGMIDAMKVKSSKSMNSSAPNRLSWIFLTKAAGWCNQRGFKYTKCMKTQVCSKALVLGKKETTETGAGGRIICIIFLYVLLMCFRFLSFFPLLLRLLLWNIYHSIVSCALSVWSVHEERCEFRVDKTYYLLSICNFVIDCERSFMQL